MKYKGDGWLMIRVKGGTHPGIIESNNQDAILCDEERGIAVIADGMGGHSGGEIAANIVIDTFAKTYSLGADLNGPLQEANDQIINLRKSQSSLSRAGSTVVAASVDNRSFGIVWIGDSRAYLWRGGHGMRRITRDHSLVEMLQSSGKVLDAETRGNYANVITRVLGRQDARAEYFCDTWQEGDLLLLCSDGLHKELDDREIESILENKNDLGTAVSILIERALGRGGHDNVSVILIGNDANIIKHPL